jgi:hypothetical protein
MLRRTAFFVVGCGSRLSNRAKNELRQYLQSVLLVSLHCAASRIRDSCFTLRTPLSLRYFSWSATGSLRRK